MRQLVAVGLGVVGLVLVGGVAYAAGKGSSAAAGGAPAGPGGRSPGPLPSGEPDGLTASFPTSTGWEMRIAILPHRSGLSYQALYGDVVRVSLPAGAHWRQVTGAGNEPAMGPSSGTDDFVFTFVEDVTYTLAYTDSSNTDAATTIALSTGATFRATTHLAPGDYALLAVKLVDLAALNSHLQAVASNPSTGTAIEQQETVTILSAAAALPAGQNAIPFLFLMGPWAAAFGVDVHTFVFFNIGAQLPAWWPPDDANASTKAHAIYRYVGPGIDVSALPFAVTAWKRVA